MYLFGNWVPKTGLGSPKEYGVKRVKNNKKEKKKKEMAASVGLAPGRDLISSRAVAAGARPQAWMFAWLLLPWTQPLLGIPV